jgi:hypothetical protein
MATALLTLDSSDAKGNGHAKVSVIRSLNATTGRFDFGEYLDAEDGNAFEDSEVSYRLTEGKVYSVHAPLSGTRFDRYYATVYQGKIVKHCCPVKCRIDPTWQHRCPLHTPTHRG